MARAALLQLLRSQSRTFRSEGVLDHQLTEPSLSYADRLANVAPHYRASIVKIITNSTTQYALAHRHWSSRAAEDDSKKINIGPRKWREENEEETKTGFVYDGPISSTIKKVKLLSLSTCCLSVSLGPVITFMTSPDMNVILKGGVASSVIFLSATTTAALHWFVSPYIHRLKWQPGSDSFDVEMMSWLGTFLPKTIKFADIRYPETNRPYVSFKANGEFYFVDADNCHNKALLAKLTPRKQESPFKNL